jgi:hypothetical protein
MYWATTKAELSKEWYAVDLTTARENVHSQSWQILSASQMTAFCPPVAYLHLSMHPHRIHSELDVKAHAPPH